MSLCNYEKCHEGEKAQDAAMWTYIQQKDET